MRGQNQVGIRPDFSLDRRIFMRILCAYRSDHHDDERDGVFVLPGIPVNVELGHQSEEYSSAIEPELELNLFHAATVASTTFAF